MQRPTAVRGGGAFGAPHGAPFGGAHAPTRLGRAFRSVDFYRKLPRDMTEGTEEAREFSVSNYGRDEWWLLLDPVEGASS